MVAHGCPEICTMIADARARAAVSAAAGERSPKLPVQDVLSRNCCILDVRCGQIGVSCP